VRVLAGKIKSGEEMGLAFQPDFHIFIRLSEKYGKLSVLSFLFCFVFLSIRK
jgi:hypothetical protein